jgi:hypothetical protein
MSAPAIPDVLGDLRTWLRTLPSLSSLTGNRAFFAFPANATFPAIRIYRSGGAMQPGETPIRDPRITIEIASSDPSQNAAIGRASDVLEGELHVLQGPIGASTFVSNAQVNTAYDSPDPVDDMPRKFLDVTFTVKAQ